MRKLLSLLIAVQAVACSMGGQADTALPRIPGYAVIDTLPVRVEVLERGDFNKTIVCNGRIEASRKASISYPVSGMVSRVLVREGEQVSQGDMIGLLDDSNSRDQLQLARIDYRQALMNLEDRLADMDMSIEDTVALSSQQKQAMYMTTGFMNAQIALARAESGIEACTIRAPFPGKIADLQGREYQMAHGEFCKLVDDGMFTVRFQVIDSELKRISRGLPVSVSPFTDRDLRIAGTITSINPLVSDNGMVNVQAQIPGAPGLVDGMNVLIHVNFTIPEAMVVPRSAVITSNGHPMLFTYSAGKSVWNYVDIVTANDEQYMVEPDTKRNSPLKEGDMVILGGVENLIDGSPVTIIE